MAEPGREAVFLLFWAAMSENTTKYSIITYITIYTYIHKGVSK
jgi:hypothetical protein